MVLSAHRNNEKLVAPIQYRNCNWLSLSIASLQALPGQWINSASTRKKDDLWTEVSKELESRIEKWRVQNKGKEAGIGHELKNC